MNIIFNANANVFFLSPSPIPELHTAYAVPHTACLAAQAAPGEQDSHNHSLTLLVGVGETEPPDSQH